MGTIRSALRVGLILAAIVLPALLQDRASAYNDDGHFYTAISIAHSHLPAFKNKPREAAVLMMFCAQLPDLAKEFDAVNLRVRLLPSVRGLFWGGFSRCWGIEVCHMVTVHHYLHGLTDAESRKVTAAAVEILATLLPKTETEAELDPNRVCAAGFAIHLLGDSFAHRRLDSPEKMYPPGLGHYHDDHNPDFILYDESRRDSYVEYAKELDKALKSTPNDVRWTVLSEMLERNREGATLDNRFNETKLRADFRLMLEEEGSVYAPYKPAVEELNGTFPVITKTCKAVIEKYQLTNSLDCNKIWRVYKEAAVPAFEKQNIPQTCPPDDKWSDGMSK